jgi:predicted flap endonuclease-1-like 5' DNA nuclease
MYYLISQYIWWLIFAFLIGLIVGWLTCSRNADRRLGWLWPLLIVGVIAFLLTWLRFINGVPALWVETALLFLGTYLAGCCIGCWLKSAFTSDDLAAGGVREWHKNLDAPGPGIMAGGDAGGVREWNKDIGGAAPVAAAAAVAAVAAPQPVAPKAPETPPTPKPKPAPVAATPAPKPADPPLMPKVEGEDQIAGKRPVGFMSPRGGKADDLKLIRGIGKQNEGRLHGLGIWHFDQIADWTRANVEWVGSYLAFPGRIDREEWLKQAKLLAAGKETDFAKRVKRGEVATSKDDGSLGQGNVEKLDAPPPRPTKPGKS